MNPYRQEGNGQQPTVIYVQQQPQPQQQQHVVYVTGTSNMDGVGSNQVMNAELSGVAAMEASVRRGFVVKVFSIIAVQLLVTFGIVSIFLFNESFNNYIRGNRSVYWLSVGVFFFALIVLSCFGDVARSHPWGYVFLGIITVAMSFMLSVIATSVSRETILVSVAGTTAIVIALTMFAAFTKYDFTKYGPYALVALLGLIIFGLALAFIRESQTTRLVYASIGIVLFSFFIVYDVQLVVGGKHTKYSYEVDDYVFAALNIYLDIVNLLLFMFIAVDNS